MRLRADYSARQRRAQAISATESSSSQWPTSKVLQGGPNSGRLDRGAGGPDLQEAANNWPTPTTRDYKDTGNLDNVPENGLLGRVAANWSTPRSTDGEKGGPNQSFGAGGQPLPAQAAQWMTLRVSEHGQYQYNKGDRNKPVLTLQGQAQTWATPSVADTTGGRMARSGDQSNEPLLKGQAEKVTLASFLPDHPISTVGEESSHIRRTLNPLFVEWLMGWPPGWTSLALTPPASNACACSVTALSLWKRHMRSALFSLGLPPEAPPPQLSLFG